LESAVLAVVNAAKGERARQDATEHLLASQANVERLIAAKHDIEAGRVVERDLRSGNRPAGYFSGL
jgi:hypothetical protein